MLPLAVDGCFSGMLALFQLPPPPQSGQGSYGLWFSGQWSVVSESEPWTLKLLPVFFKSCCTNCPPMFLSDFSYLIVSDVNKAV